MYAARDKIYVLLLILAISMAVMAACAPPQATTPTATGVLVVYRTATPEPTITVDYAALGQTRGEVKYNVYCAHCHGYAGEGQHGESAEHTMSLGYIPVPPHDETGHTWMHTDEQLIKVVRDGIQSPLHLYPMSGFGTVLSEEEIVEVIEYIKGWWTDEQRARQQEITQHARQVREEAGLPNP